MEVTVDSRRYEMDWLRVIAFAILVVFLCGCAFSPQWGSKYPQ